MNIYQGISASAGIGIGKSFTLTSSPLISVPQIKIAETERAKGWERFEESLKAVNAYFNSLIDFKNKAQKNVLETYQMMLCDPDFISQIEQSYNTHSFNIEFIVQQKTDEAVNQLMAAKDAYLTERATDIQDVFGRVIKTMLGYSATEMEQIPDEAVIIANEIPPSIAMSIFQKKISAIVLTEGGISSHVAILARTYGIPFVFGIENVETLIPQNSQVIVDGKNAKVIVNPAEYMLTDYQEKKAHLEVKLSELAQFIKKDGVTKDGTPITLLANIGTVQEATLALENGADGIGLFRTEFLFMQDHTELISEDAQYKAYSEVLKIMKGKPVTIRTLDVGGDKILTTDSVQFKVEKNPLLGCRAIRFCLARKDIFKTQLRALYRASVDGNLKIMLPLLTGLSQLEEAKKIIHEVKTELKTEGIPFNEKTPLGIMIETPAAAVIADLFAAESDFFSIGTNDLTQYTISVDRENTDVADLYSELNPAVLRLIKFTITCANEVGIPVSVCGEMAGKEEGVLTLVGLGVRTLSMTCKNISQVKELLSHHTIDELKKQVNSLPEFAKKK